ncbi:MAG TPA: EAL domain-containing protein [Rudaea sp.]|nr:EAL domain-containing protein [Rudaea sp.]
MPFSERSTQYGSHERAGDARSRVPGAKRTLLRSPAARMRILAGWLLLCVLAGAWAEERRFFIDARGDDQGLAQHTVNAFFQDRDGIIWIATQGGLNAYDGYRYQLYQHDADDANSLPDDFITAIAQDSQDRLWLGSATAGITSLDPASGKVVRAVLPEGTADRERRGAIKALAFDRRRGLWLGTAAGIELFDVDNRSRRELFRFDSAQGDDQVSALACAADGTLWAATTSGLLRIAPGSDHADAIAADALGSATALFVAADGVVFAGTRSGLFRVDAAANRAERLWPHSQQADVSRDADVRSIVQDASGRLWLAIAGAGLAIVDARSGAGETLQREPDMPGSLPENNNGVLFVDRSGLLWIGGTTRGFATVDPRGATFRYVADLSAEPIESASNDVRAIWEDEHGYLWLGTHGDGLRRYDRASGKFDSFDDVVAQSSAPASGPPPSITALRAANGGGFWIGSDRGVHRLDADRRHATALPIDPGRTRGLPSPHVSALLPAHDGSLWIGTADSGIARWWPDEKRWEYFRHEDADDSLVHDSVLSLLEDRDGRIWIGTLAGLSLYDARAKSMRNFRSDAGDAHSLSGDAISAMLQTRDGTLWIGTRSGLNRLDAEPGRGGAHFTHFQVRDGLASAAINGLLEDRNGVLWLSTNRGISSFDREHELFHNFSLKDGLQGLEFNAGAALALSNGELAFGGGDGLNLLDPASIQLSRYAAPVAITAIQVDRSARRIPPGGDDLVMSQSDRVVRFEFAALDYTAPQRNEFSFRLYGFDDAWTRAGTRHEATYTNLPAGDYRFEVRGSNHDGVWNDRSASAGLVVERVWWARPLMLALYTALALLAIARMSHEHVRRREQERAHHRALTERENRLRLALWGSGDEFWDWDLRQDELVATGVGDILSGVSADRPASTSRWIDANVHPDDRAALDERIADHLAGRTGQLESEHRLRGRDGQWLWVHVRGKIVEYDEDGKALRMCGTVRDVSSSRAAERERRIAAEVIDSMTEAVCVTDLEFRFTSINRAFARMTGYDESAAIGQSAALLDCDRHPPEYYQAMRDQFVRNGHWRGELWQKRHDGTEFLCWLEISAVLDSDGTRTHYVCVMNDITDRKRAEQELRYLANYDPMTGLPNRALLSERLTQAIVRARRRRRCVAVLFLDLDRFKHINDSMGHAAGDRTLRAAGARLRERVALTDTVARIGGDEFTVVLENVERAEDAEACARDLLHAFVVPLHLESGEEVVISPSIGISLYPDHGQAPDELLKFADTAMYQAKESGRNTYMMYAPAMDAAARSRANLIAALHRGLERNEFSVVYQPTLSLNTGAITGVEALLRWHSEELGQIPPSIFIPLAEESGLIMSIGDFVLDAACAQLRRWHDEGLAHLTVAVNLSMLQLLRGELTSRLAQVLASHGVRADRLELELTESVVMAAAERSAGTLDELKAIGVMLAIDDFGTGYSSLSYLKRLPIDTLKIDRAFVGDITTDPDDEAITATIIAMAHSLGLNVVAEGVETAQQFEYLHLRGCDEIQGFWFSAPLEPEACLAFLTRHQRSRSQPAPA